MTEKKIFTWEKHPGIECQVELNSLIGLLEESDERRLIADIHRLNLTMFKACMTGDFTPMHDMGKELAAYADVSHVMLRLLQSFKEGR